MALTTHNRRDVFTTALTHWLKYAPDARIVVVDDGSTIPVDHLDVQVIRHDYPKGIAAAKNAGIAALMDHAGVGHLFLADDDVWPVDDGWWRPYTESPEPHLMFGWPHRNPKPRPSTGWPPRLVGGDDRHDAYSFPRGVLLYTERRVIDRVGGMDTGYGAHGGEHVDWSQRIHDAKLTTFPFMDVKGSHQLWYSRDKTEGNGEGSSRFGVPERRRMCEANGKRWGHRWDGWPFFPYREGVTTAQDWSDGPYFEDLDGHVFGLHPHRVVVNPQGDPGLASGDYVILQDRNWMRQFADRYGWMSVGHNETSWAVRVL